MNNTVNKVSVVKKVGYAMSELEKIIQPIIEEEENLAEARQVVRESARRKKEVKRRACEELLCAGFGEFLSINRRAISRAIHPGRGRR